MQVILINVSQRVSALRFERLDVQHFLLLIILFVFERVCLSLGLAEEVAKSLNRRLSHDVRLSGQLEQLNGFPHVFRVEGFQKLSRRLLLQQLGEKLLQLLRHQMLQQRFQVNEDQPSLLAQKLDDGVDSTRCLAN